MSGTPLDLSVPISPVSGTGSDIHEKDYSFEFGDVNVASDGSKSWISGVVRDVTVGLIVALAAKYAWKAIK